MKRKQNEESIHELAGRLVEAKEKARQLGMFVDDRELLTCPECRLMEDVSVNSILLTCYPTNLGVDTGLRFVETDKAAHRFRCPACGVEFTAREVEE
jgi:uncharacterized C2H2 Zn-finger protein